MDISTNLVEHTDSKYVYTIHSTPLDYCFKLMTAGSRGGKVVFRGNDLTVKGECYFYNRHDLKKFIDTSIETYYIYFNSRIILLDVVDNKMIIDSTNEDFVLRVLSIVHSGDFNIEEVWSDLVERVKF